MNLNRRKMMGQIALGIFGLMAPARLSSGVGKRPVTLPAADLDRQEPLPYAVGRAMAALRKHRASLQHHDRIGVADYSRHSSERRFHIVDATTGQIEKSFHVAHGRGSDPGNSGFVEKLSNTPGSGASSGGSFLTGKIYYGKHGRSRRLHGLEPQNDRAFDRAIVIHGAAYVNAEQAAVQGRVGRSLGCFAFDRQHIDEILDLLGQGRMVYSFS